MLGLCLPFEQSSINHVMISWERIIIDFHLLRCIEFELPLLNSPLYMLPENSALVSRMRSSVMKLAELLILQLIGRQHNMISGQLDLSLLKQEIEELVRFCDVEIIAFFNSFSPRIWHHYCLLTSISFGHNNIFFFIVLIAVID